MSNNISEFLTTTTYHGETVVDVFKKIEIPSEAFDVSAYEEYIIKEGDRWDRLARKFYGDVNLWWLLASYNKVVDPFNVLIPGNKIKILDGILISNILLKMKGYLK